VVARDVSVDSCDVGSDVTCNVAWEMNLRHNGTVIAKELVGMLNVRSAVHRVRLLNGLANVTS
jgi:hypothetical protein